MVWERYTWILVVGALGALFTSYGIGANDLVRFTLISVKKSL